MGSQVIVQPDGKLALWSSVVDGWTHYDATPEQIVEHFAERAAAQARSAAQRVVDLVVAGDTRGAYAQFAMTFDEADAEHLAGGNDPVPFGFRSAS